MINTLATTITSGLLSLGLIVGITVMAVSSVEVPDIFYQLLPVTVTAAIVGAARSDSKDERSAS